MQLYAYMMTVKKQESRGNNRIFIAQAVTDSVPFDQENWWSQGILSPRAPRGQSERIMIDTRHCARVKILSEYTDGTDAHTYLPNPCDSATAADSAEARMAITQYTLGLTGRDYTGFSNEGMNINTGDILRISCRVNRRGMPITERAIILETIDRPASLGGTGLIDIEGTCSDLAGLDWSESATIARPSLRLAGHGATSTAGASLHDAYMGEYRDDGPGTATSVADLYRIMAMGIDSPTAGVTVDGFLSRSATFINTQNIILGILANAHHESGFIYNIVSAASTESSIGLWQMNVGSEGAVSNPTNYVQSNALDAIARGNMSDNLKIPDDADVVPYYAGGLFLRHHGATVVTNAQAASGTSVSTQYELFANDTLAYTENPAVVDETPMVEVGVINQVAFVIETVATMIVGIDLAGTAVYSAEQWCYWFQIYFEQPAEINDRTGAIDGIVAEIRAAGYSVYGRD
jgi:hypothetical protein